MREIKFRAWDEGNMIMHYDVEFIRSGVDGCDWIIFKSDKQTLKDKKVLNNPYFQQQIKIMQHTGHQNIYEKDIVLITAEDDYENVLGKEMCVVDFDRAAFVFAPSFKHRGLSIDGLFNRYKNATRIKFEVVGNVYETPELLKEVQ